MQGYCVKCRAKKEIKNAEIVTLKNGRQATQGVCPTCGKHCPIEEMEGDHTKPWHEGGRTIAENCQMLCVPCNRAKAGR